MKNETIVDRVVERLKAQPLGDLITEEDLHDIVKQAIPKTFFEERVVKDGSYHTKTLPPIIVELMSVNLREAAEKAVKDWLVANSDQVIEYWKQVLDKGLAAYVQKVQDDQATAMVRNTLRGWIDAINQERGRAGLPMIGTI